MTELLQRGVLRVVPPAQLDAALERQARDKARREDEATAAGTSELSGLAQHIRTRYDLMRRHRDTIGPGWSNRLLNALRVFNGQYEPEKLADIQKFGGSTVYARIIAMKCRGASSLLRDVYLSSTRPWGLSPPSDPDIPEQVLAAIQQLVTIEGQTLAQAGQPPDPNQVRDRIMQLVAAARSASKKRAGEQARVAEEKLDEILQEGGFYRALAEFVADLPLFPFACIKGPVVRVVPSVQWGPSGPIVEQKPRLTWTRVSPFDVWFTPGVSGIEDAEVIERTRVTRSDLNDLLDLPGYNVEAVRAVLDDYGRGGMDDEWDYTDTERAIQESRENPRQNASGLIACLEFHGNVQGRTLHDAGMDKKQVPDELRDYFVQAWIIGRHVIKVQLAPSPRKRHPYFITSFEKVPGTPVGNGLPDILNDIQDVGNAALRSLVNNMAISSGPQVVLDEERLSPLENAEEMFPWKRWRVRSGFVQNSSQVPISFFQPNSNAQELLGVYQKMCDLADELSAIPKYLSGETGGGAGRTASGLAMLMNNASKILQTVAANIDRDVMEPLLQQLYDMVMLTDTSGMLTGQESVVVRGVSVAVQRETQRARQLEFLQTTANPIDAQIMGPKGRAAVLRAVADTIGIEGSEVVPTEDEIAAMQQASQNAQMAGAAGMGEEGGAAKAGAQAQGTQKPPATTGDMGPRANAVTPRISGGVH